MKLLLAVLLNLVVFASAQDTLNRKLLHHKIGFQANQLIKQVVNLNNNSVAIDNPYLLTYDVCYGATNWGLSGGFGMSYEHFEDKESASPRNSKISNYSFRIGPSYSTRLGKKLVGIFALHYVGNFQQDKTLSSSVLDLGFRIDSTISTTNSKTIVRGAGFNFNVSYAFSNRISMGTEVSYIFKQSSITEHSMIEAYQFFPSNPSENIVQLSSSNLSSRKENIDFFLPISLFLILSF